MITEPARAKINLCLHVTGRRADGYHLLDSLVAFADVGDVLRVEPADQLTLEVSGPFSAGLPVDNDNLILRAAHLVDAQVRISLEKNLPVASGIGGGSADAAACLRALQQLGYDMPSDQAVLSLGADVPVCLSQKTTRMRGIGDELMPANLSPPMHAVLVNAGVPVSTRAVFSTLASVDNSDMHWPPQEPLVDWLAQQRNDLQAAAIAIAPEIRDVLKALDEAGAQLSRMSGSGATCFGLFESEQSAAAATRSLAGHRWWVKHSALGR